MYNKEILDDIKDISISDYLEHCGFTTRHAGPNTIAVNRCPICGGKGEHFRIDVRENKYTSFGANCTYTQKRGSIIDLVMEMDGLNWLDAIEELKDFGNISTDNSFFRSSTVKEKSFTKPKVYEKPVVDTNFNAVVERNLKCNNVEYYSKRGISDSIIKKYGLLCNGKGLNDFLGEEYVSLHSKLGFVFQYFIPIRDVNGDVVSFVIRANDNVLENTLNRYRKSNPDFKLEKTHNLKSLPMIPFNYGYFENKELLNNKNSNYIYICEGIFDALSLESLGENAISLNSANNYNKIIPFVKENTHIKEYIFVLCGDNDAAGIRFNNELKKIFDDNNLISVKLNISEEYHDVNDMLVKNTGNERSMMENIKNDLKEQVELKEVAHEEKVYNEAVKNAEMNRNTLIASGSYSMEDNTAAIDETFITNDIVAGAINFDDEVEFNPSNQLRLESLPLLERFMHSKANSRKSNSYKIETGFKGLNELLRYANRKIVGIGAIPGAGKTTLCLNLATNLAKQKKHCIFYSLELDTTYVQAKILSSLSISEGFSTGYINAEDIYYFLQDAIPTLNIEQEDNLFNLICFYEENIKPYLIIDDFIDRKRCLIAQRTIEAIMAHTKDFIVANKVVPVVFIDYIQQVETENVGLINDKQKIDYIAKKIIAMKKLLGTTVFLISSLNRDSYLEPISETSFKESGAIEYAADLLLGCQWRGMAKMVREAESKSKLKEMIEKLKTSSTLFRKLEIIVVKHRTGTPGSCVNMDFYGKYNLFTDADVNPCDKAKTQNDDNFEQGEMKINGIFENAVEVDLGDSEFVPRW